MFYDNSKFQASMGNLIGYYLTLPIRFGDYSVDYDLENTIFATDFYFGYRF